VRMRLAPPVLVAAAACSSLAGSPRVSWYLLVLAIPATFATGLRLFGTFVDGESLDADIDLMRLALFATALGIVLLASVAPRVGVAACVAALCALGIEAALAVAPPAALVVLRGRR
jgi:hypothetical protein